MASYIYHAICIKECELKTLDGTSENYITLDVGTLVQVLSVGESKTDEKISIITIFNSNFNSKDNNCFVCNSISLNPISNTLFEILKPIDDKSKSISVYGSLDLLSNIIQNRKNIQLSFLYNKKFYCLENFYLEYVVKTGNPIMTYFGLRTSEPLKFPFPIFVDEFKNDIIIITADKFFDYIEVNSNICALYQHLFDLIDWKNNLLNDNFLIQNLTKQSHERDTGTIPKVIKPKSTLEENLYENIVDGENLNENKCFKVAEDDQLNKLTEGLVDFIPLYHKNTGKNNFSKIEYEKFPTQNKSQLNKKMAQDASKVINKKIENFPNDNKVSKNKNNVLFTTPPSANYVYDGRNQNERNYEAVEQISDKFNCSKCKTNNKNASAGGILILKCCHTLCYQCIASNMIPKAHTVKCPCFNINGKPCESLIKRYLNVSEEIVDFEKTYIQSSNAVESDNALEVMEGIYKCKTFNCKGFWFIEDGARLVKCPACDTYNCIDCQTIHTGKTCIQYKASVDNIQENKYTNGNRKWKCEMCNSFNKYTHDFCKECNHQKNKNIWFCMHCKLVNYSIDLNYAQCEHCGYPTCDVNTGKERCSSCSKFTDSHVMSAECGHFICLLCLSKHVVPGQLNKCKSKNCKKNLSGDIVKLILNEADSKVYDKLLAYETNQNIKNAFFCTNPECAGFWIIDFDDNNRTNYHECPLCETINCISCQAIHLGFKNCKKFQNFMDHNTKDAEVKYPHVIKRWSKLYKNNNYTQCQKCNIYLFHSKQFDFLYCSICDECVKPKKVSRLLKLAAASPSWVR